MHDVLNNKRGHLIFCQSTKIYTQENIRKHSFLNRINKIQSYYVTTIIIKTDIGLTLPHFPPCPKPGPGFPTSYCVVFFMLNDLR
jgi:hypothetical protein